MHKSSAENLSGNSEQGMSSVYPPPMLSNTLHGLLLALHDVIPNPSTKLCGDNCPVTVSKFMTGWPTLCLPHSIGLSVTSFAR